MNLTETICRQAAAYTAVAFDVFDTLLLRDAAAPTDIFRRMGLQFYEDRTRAEREARAEKHGEVTLSDIYARPCMTDYDPADECAAELAACTANLPVLQAAERLKQQGKRLYYISDMYLPKEQIDAMLRRCGYTCFDGGFVSCSYGVQKRSGKLFKRFLSDTGLDSREVLFIGDSWRADIAGAALAGIHAWHLNRGPQPADCVEAFIRNRLPSLASEPERLGFTIAGPLAVGFCQWLHALREQHPQAQVYFLARDMYLMREVYGILYPEERTQYLQVSRRSLCPAFLANRDIDHLLYALPRQQLTGAQLAAYCGTTCPSDSADVIFDCKAAPSQALRDFLLGLPAPQHPMQVIDYLTQQGISSGDLLVDIGSGGTTQLLIETLLEISLHGAQLSADERLRARFSADETSVYLFDGQPAPRLYWAGQPILERLISEDSGTTLGYACLNGTVKPVLAENTPEPLLTEFQRGVRQFAVSWRSSCLYHKSILPQTSIAPFLRLIEDPTASEIKALGRLTVEDGGTYPLAAPKKAGYYLTHPAAARHDFSVSRWKIAFLKELLPIPLPYGKIYLTLKK